MSNTNINTASTTTAASTVAAEMTAMERLAAAINAAKAAASVTVINPANNKPIGLAEAIDKYDGMASDEAIKAAKAALVAKSASYKDFLQYCGETQHTYSFTNFNGETIHGLFACTLMDVFSDDDKKAWNRVCREDVAQYHKAGEHTNEKGKIITDYESLVIFVVEETNALEGIPNVEHPFRNELLAYMNKLMHQVDNNRNFAAFAAVSVANHCYRMNKEGKGKADNISKAVMAKIWDYCYNGRKNEKAEKDLYDKGVTERTAAITEVIAASGKRAAAKGKKTAAK